MKLSIDVAWCRSPGDEAAASSGPMETEDEATLGRIAVNVDRIRLTQALDARTMRAHEADPRQVERIILDGGASPDSRTRGPGVAT